MSYQNAIGAVSALGEVFGTAFLITDDRRHVVTAAHVVETLDAFLAKKKRSFTGNVYIRFLHARVEIPVCRRLPLGSARGHDWMVLELEQAVDEKIVPLNFRAPESEAAAIAWGYPALMNNSGASENTVLLGKLADVESPDEQGCFKLICENMDDSPEGMSGAPVLVRGAWVGMVLGGHDIDGKPAYRQMRVLGQQIIVDACCEAGLLVRGSHYGIPSLSDKIGLPEEDPFPGPVPLNEEYARLLLGRFQDLAELINYVRHPTERVVLYTGRAGVGKSSLLQAGLVPHLQSTYGYNDVRLHICSPQEPPLTTLAKAAARCTADTLIILDQAEECLAGSGAEARAQTAEFARTLVALDTPGSSTRPACIVLGCRADYRNEMERCLRDAGVVGMRHMGLRPLSEESIEQILRLDGDRTILKRYHIEIAYSEDAPRRFAKALLADTDTTVAPLLQLRLRQMYEKARGNTKGGKTRFDDDLYTEVAKDLSSLEAYLAEQLSGWPAKLDMHVKSGLVLDILEYHTSPQGTAQPRSRADLNECYASPTALKPGEQELAQVRLGALLKELTSRKLLVDCNTPGGTTIGHDEIARVIKQAFERSPRPGQRSRRLLEFRLQRKEEGRVPPLGVHDLRIVKAGLSGMRIPTSEENEYLQSSRQHLVKTRGIAWGLPLLVAALVGTMAIQTFLFIQNSNAGKALHRLGELRLAEKNFPLAEKAFAEALVLDSRNEDLRKGLLQARSAAVLYKGGGKTGATTLSRDGRVRVVESLRGDIRVETDDGLRWDIARTWEKLENMAVSSAWDGQRWLAIAYSYPEVEKDSEASELQSPRKQPRAEVHEISLYRLKPGTEKPVPIDEPARKGAKRTSSIQFSTLPHAFAAASDDGWVGVYDINATANSIRTRWDNAAAHGIAAHGLAFHPDGRMLATGGGDGNYNVKLWSETGTLVRELEGNRDSIFALAFSDDGRQLAAAGYDRAIHVWSLPETGLPDRGWQDAKNHANHQLMHGHSGVVLDLMFSRSGTLLASAGKDETVRVWDTRNMRGVLALAPDLGVLRSIALDDFGGLLASAGEKGWTRWQTGAREEAYKLWLDGAAAGAVAIDPHGRFLAIGDHEGRLWRWRLEKSTQARAELVGKREPFSAKEKLTINGLAFSPDGRWIAVVGEGSRVDLWNTQQDIWRPVKAQLALPGAWGVAFDSQSRWLVATGEGGPTEQGNPVVQTSTCRCDAASALACAQHHPVKVWNTDTWTLQQQINVPHIVYSVAITEDRLVAGNANGELCSYQLPMLEASVPIKLVEKAEQNIWSVAAYGRSGEVISGNSDGLVRITNVRLRSEDLVAPADERKINPTLNSVAYNARRGRIAAAGDGAQLVEYEVAVSEDSGKRYLRPAQRYPGQEGTVWMVTYSPDGRWLAYSGLDGFVRVIDHNSADMVARGNGTGAEPRVLLEDSRAATGLRN